MRDLQRERRRLRRAFGAALVAVLPAAAAAQACSDSSATKVDGTPDATVDRVDEPFFPDLDGGDEFVVLDDGSCSTVGYPHDANPDAPDVDPGCVYILPCGFGDDSQVEFAQCQVFTKNPGDAAPDSPAIYCSLREGAGCTDGSYTPGPNGAVTLDCNDCFGGAGRRPVGLARPRARRARTALGAWLARMAHDEAASVHAFQRMRVELTHFGAPRSLIDAADRAARDEVRHARVMSSLATRHGGRVARPRVRKPQIRSLEAMARENAIEGCVHETFGALVLAWQARRASDPALRATFARLASDELDHAALSWSLHRWANMCLDARARGRIAAARKRALASLRASLENASGPRELGRPSAAESVALLDRLRLDESS